MPQIEIHVFEVQLGAALLLRLEDSGGEPVTILADAGINAATYSQDHVARKLRVILGSGQGGTNSRPIDLMIGTHYDQDHLAGMIDVADQFTVTEAMLPPIRKPRHSAAVPTTTARVESMDLDDIGDLPLLVDLKDEEFAEHIAELERIASDAVSELLSLGFTAEEFVDLETEVLVPDEEFDLDTQTASLWQVPPGLVVAQLSRIRASAHKGAIVAKWLHRLVKKLKSKNVPIRALDIQAGSPEYFVWDKVAAKFINVVSSAYASSAEPKFTLLGPSRQLIAHHARKLPIGVYFALHRKIPLKPVTASN
jgi:hypothetical protein